MKNLNFIIILFFVSSYMKAQMAVSDAGVTAAAIETKVNTAATLTKTTEMLSQMTEMRKKYEEMRKDIEIVNDVVSTGKSIKNITSALTNISNNYTKAVNYIESEPSIKSQEKVKFINAFNKIMGGCVDNLDEAYSLTTSGNYKMGDGDRLNMLNTILKEMNHQNSLMVYFLQKIQTSVKKVEQKNKDKAMINKLNSASKK